MHLRQQAAQPVAQVAAPLDKRVRQRQRARREEERRAEQLALQRRGHAHAATTRPPAALPAAPAAGSRQRAAPPPPQPLRLRRRRRAAGSLGRRRGSAAAAPAAGGGLGSIAQARCMRVEPELVACRTSPPGPAGQSVTRPQQRIHSGQVQHGYRRIALGMSACFHAATILACLPLRLHETYEVSRCTLSCRLQEKYKSFILHNPPFYLGCCCCGIERCQQQRGEQSSPRHSADIDQRGAARDLRPCFCSGRQWWGISAHGRHGAGRIRARRL